LNGPQSIPWYDALDFVARALAHILDPRRHLVYYYGAYSNVARGNAKANGHAAKAQPLAPGPGGEPSPPSPALAALRRRWAQLIRRIYQVDPLLCPRCRGVMRVVSFITQPRLIRRILEHLAGRAAHERAPPAAAGAVPVIPSSLSSGREATRPPRPEVRPHRDPLAPITRLTILEEHRQTAPQRSVSFRLPGRAPTVPPSAPSTSRPCLTRFGARNRSYYPLDQENTV
jgi:hypothetical protein